MRYRPRHIEIMRSQVRGYIILILSDVLTKEGPTLPILEELFAILHDIRPAIGLDFGIV